MGAMEFLVIVLTALFFRPACATDCGNCVRDCTWYDGICIAQKAACQSGTVPFRTFTSVADSLCRLFRLTDEDVVRLDDAKDILTTAKFFTREELDRVDYFFCPLLEITNSGGFAPSERAAIFNVDLRERPLLSLASLMAHEVKHVRQYQQMSFAGFACKYTAELLAGNGFGPENEIEAEAFAFQDTVDACIFNNANCPV